MVIQEGTGQLMGWHDPDENRKWVEANKPRDMTDKTMPINEAVKKFVKDGDFLAMGGFGHVRVSMVAIYEMIRQRRKNLIMAGKTAVHDVDLLIGGGCVDRIEVAYAFAHELRGLSACGRRAVETGRVNVLGEISNAGYQWRFLAAMMGLPFMPSRTMLGTDTLEKSSAKVIRDPFSGKPICLLPACYPDIAVIHVPRCDVYGNCQIDGTMVEDFELARAARRLIISTEEIIPNDDIRAKPWLTKISFLNVDAVVLQKYGSHPCQMPLQYFFDEEHIGEWLNSGKSDEGIEKYMEKYVHSVENFDEYIKVIGGEARMKELAEVENLTRPMTAPWMKKGGK
ncbi:MAG: CoA-transferase [Thermoplasmata archaeon]